VQDLLGAVRASRAVKVYICNIVTQEGETDNFSCYDHIRALEEHVGDRLFDILLCNENFNGQLNEGDQWVRIDEKTRSDSRTHFADLIRDGQPWRHDPVKLADALMDVLDEYTGPLE
jgi:uncharacterized cofD-like protein